MGRIIMKLMKRPPIYQSDFNYIRMRPLTLYKQDASPPARAVLMVGDMLGVNFQFVEPNFFEGALREPDYVKKNPMRTLPLLEDGDFALADSHAIVIYLITKYGADKREKLYPCDYQTRAYIHQRMFFDTAILFPRLRAVSLPTFLSNLTGVTDEQRDSIEDGYGMLEAYLQNGQYVVGNNLTVADICVGATVTTLNELVKIDPEKFPKSFEWMGRINEEETFVKANAPGVAKFGAMINSFWEKNKDKK